MAGVTSDQSDNLNVELNLVPFIDLLSCLVAFLLITAVWTQIASLPTAVQSKGKMSRELNQTMEDRIQIHLSTRGMEFTWPTKLSRGTSLPNHLANNKEDFDFEGLAAILQHLPKGESFSGAVSSEDDVTYGNVIHAVDAMKSGGIQSVALSTN